MRGRGVSVGGWCVRKGEGTGEDSGVGGVNEEGCKGERLKWVGLPCVGGGKQGRKGQRAKIGG